MIGVDGAASAEPWLELFIASLSGVATAGCTWLFARIAERRGWVDDGSDAPQRKLQARPVAPIGGAAILCGSALGAIIAAMIGGWNHLPGLDVSRDPSLVLALPRRTWIVLALAAAFAVGLSDDLKSRGLSPVQKLAGQMLAAALLALAFAGPGDGGAWRWDSLLFWFVGGVVAQNAINTFDNADGAASALGLLAFAPVAPLLAGALCGFLPFNLWIRRTVSSGARTSSVPRAYLGDSGSHLLGLLLLLHPLTRLVLFLPLLDLARVALVRMRQGGAPWIGDRRHLAHRMQASGWTPTATVAGLCLIALPLWGAGLFTLGRSDGGYIVAIGAACSLLFFIIALGLCPTRA